MYSFWQDLRYGVHVLVKYPVFTLVAVLTLALGVGANTALFSIVDAVLLKKLPVAQPDELVLFSSTWNQNFSPGGYNGSNQRDKVTGLVNATSFPFQTFDRFRQERNLLSDAIAFSSIDVNLNVDGQAEVVSGQVVSGNYYSMLGVPAVLGRTIIHTDDDARVTPVAMLSYRFWQKRFGGDPSVIGKQVNINSIPFTVVGVSQKGFEGTMQVGSIHDITLPLAWEPQLSGERSMMRGGGYWWLRIMGRLKPGVTAPQVQTALENIFHQTVLRDLEKRRVRLVPLSRRITLA
jgi:MacB-like periplasmic core domain